MKIFANVVLWVLGILSFIHIWTAIALSFHCGRLPHGNGEVLNKILGLWTGC